MITATFCSDKQFARFLIYKRRIPVSTQNKVALLFPDIFIHHENSVKTLCFKTFVLYSQFKNRENDIDILAINTFELTTPSLNTAPVMKSCNALLFHWTLNNTVLKSPFQTPLLRLGETVMRISIPGPCSNQ